MDEHKNEGCGDRLEPMCLKPTLAIFGGTKTSIFDRNWQRTSERRDRATAGGGSEALERCVCDRFWPHFCGDKPSNLDEKWRGTETQWQRAAA